MALKTRLSEAARIELAKNLDAFWFVEMMDVLRNTGSFSDRSYSDKRPLSELEHQALNGSYRQGFISCVEHIPNLIAEIKERPKVEQPFGSLVQQPPDPKSLSLAPKPEKK